MRMIFAMIAIAMTACTHTETPMKIGSMDGKTSLSDRIAEPSKEEFEARAERVGGLIGADYEAQGWRKVGAPVANPQVFFAGRFVLLSDDNSELDGKQVYCSSCQDDKCNVVYWNKGNRFPALLPARSFIAIKSLPSRTKMDEYLSLTENDFVQISFADLKPKYKGKQVAILAMTEASDSEIIRGNFLSYVQNQVNIQIWKKGSISTMPISERDIVKLAVAK